MSWINKWETEMRPQVTSDTMLASSYKFALNQRENFDIGSEINNRALATTKAIAMRMTI